MPRGVKKTVDYDAEIAKIDEMIVKQSEVLSKLKAEKKALREEKKATEVKALQEFIAKEGKTVAEILEIVKNAGK